MPAYMFVRVKIRDSKRFAEYAKAVEQLVPNYGGRYLARGPVAAVLEGSFDSEERTLLAEYPSVEHIHSLWNSLEYSQVRKLREGAGEVHVIVIDGDRGMAPIS